MKLQTLMKKIKWALKHKSLGLSDFEEPEKIPNGVIASVKRIIKEN